MEYKDEYDLEEAKDRAEELNEYGIPDRRSLAVALYEQGMLQREIADVMGTSQGNISNHISLFKSEVRRAQWLVENAPRL
jgi:DNA-directed RNA polymerase specialized sigma24 family protein